MTDQTDNATKLCPNCGKPVGERTRGMRKSFCSSSCRLEFRNRSNSEGKVVISLLKVWMETRHASPKSEDPEEQRRARVCKEARREVTKIVRTFRDRDEEAGRPSLVDYVEELLAEGMYDDRTRK
ncbi:MAG: hypothetical protein CMQ40_10805 [Gammaproteobacteria bacterium]|nr:hypothetical protein [Gammaproteobacteria bacterium]